LDTWHNIHIDNSYTADSRLFEPQLFEVTTVKTFKKNFYSIIRSKFLFYVDFRMTGILIYPASGKFLGRSLKMNAEYVPYLPSAKECVGVCFNIQRDKFVIQ